MPTHVGRCLIQIFKVMITDVKTQKQLYADTEKVLFTLENIPEAVYKMLEIIRDTPEYLQLTNIFPVHAQEDDKAEWWQTKEADYLLAELLHVLELYTPEGFIFGPVTGRTYGIGYEDAEYEKNLLYQIEIQLDPGYVSGQKDEYRKKKKYYTEIAQTFATQGYVTEIRTRAKGCRIVKGNTELHAHYSWITGYCEAIHLSQIILLLLQREMKFKFRGCQLLDMVFNFTDKEEFRYYQQQHDSTIYYQIFDLFQRKSWGAITDNLMEVASHINIPTQKRPQGFDCNSPAYQYALQAYQKLRDKGYLEEYTHTLGADEFIAAKATQKGISKNIFYETKL